MIFEACRTVVERMSSSGAIAVFCAHMVTADEAITIVLAKQRLPLAQRKDYSHFAVVRTKLKWSGGAAERMV